MKTSHCQKYTAKTPKIYIDSIAEEHDITVVMKPNPKKESSRIIFQ